MHSLSLHRVKSVAVRTFRPDNNNSLSIEILSELGDCHITLFGMPHDDALKIAEALGAPWAKVTAENGHDMSLKEYVDFRKVIAEIEGGT